MGVLLGAFVHDRKSAWRVVATVDVVAIFWGVVVGLADRALTTVVAGGALGLGNLANWGSGRCFGEKHLEPDVRSECDSSGLTARESLLDGADRPLIPRRKVCRGPPMRLPRD